MILIKKIKKIRSRVKKKVVSSKKIFSFVEKINFFYVNVRIFLDKFFKKQFLEELLPAFRSLYRLFHSVPRLKKKKVRILHEILILRTVEL